MTIGIVDDLVWVTIQIQGGGEREVVNEVLIKVGRGERNRGHSQVFAASFLCTTTRISKYLLLSFHIFVFVVGPFFWQQGSPVRLLIAKHDVGNFVRGHRRRSIEALKVNGRDCASRVRFGGTDDVARFRRGEGFVVQRFRGISSDSWGGSIGIDPIKIRDHLVPRNRVVTVGTEPRPVVPNSIRMELGIVLFMVVELPANIAEIGKFLIA